MQVMNKIAENLVSTVTSRKTEILYWPFNKLRGSSQSRCFPVTNASSGDKEKFN